MNQLKDSTLIALRVPAAVAAELRARAAAEDRSMSSLVRLAIAAQLRSLSDPRTRQGDASPFEGS